ncbi:MAG: hypothetical protein HZC45_08190 [Deltaproteobacteria bacterium]|nr:hypothetical protein [Deltaproteobacteria bacterium]
MHGGILFNEIKSLRLSLNIFLNAIDDLITSINKFKYESAHPVFWHKINRPFADKIEVTIQRGILSSDICAMALVEHSRKFNKKYPVAGYEREIKRFFHNNEQHRFIHGLRRFITHVKFTKANWEISYSKDEGRNVFFILPKNDLLEFKDWNSLARSFILKHEKGIDVENLFDVYSGEVRKFHNWLRVSLLNKYGDIISEYLRYLRVIKGFDSENYWNILIHQVIPQKNIDPYIYLDQYLTEDELEDVFSLPYRSKEQVDRIIELVDSYKICNDSMRKDIYEICKVKET